MRLSDALAPALTDRTGAVRRLSQLLPTCLIPPLFLSPSFSAPPGCSIKIQPEREQVGPTRRVTVIGPAPDIAREGKRILEARASPLSRRLPHGIRSRLFTAAVARLHLPPLRETLRPDPSRALCAQEFVRSVEDAAPGPAFGGGGAG